MGRPTQQVDVFTIQDRRAHGKTRPWVVRWRVEGQQRTRSFRTRVEADRYRSVLVHAVTNGERFDLTTGEPAQWLEGAEDLAVHEWARTWVAEQWPEWQPRTRRSAIEALTRFLPLVVRESAPKPPAALRTYLTGALDPDQPADPVHDCASWLDRHAVRLSELNKQILAAVDLQLGVGDDGKPLAAHTAGRRRTIAKACIRRAVQLDLLAADPWPPAPRGRATRKVHRKRRSVDVHTLPDPATMVRILDAIPTHQPGSRTYQQMTAVVYYAGLRPSEVVMLRGRSLTLPTDRSWGRIDVTEADIDQDVAGEPKTGPRWVPIPPVLVDQLVTMIESFWARVQSSSSITSMGIPASSSFDLQLPRDLSQPSAPTLRAWHADPCRVRSLGIYDLLSRH